MRKLKRAVIKEELVELTGNLNEAIVLNQLIFWSERVRDSDVFIKEEIERTKRFNDGSQMNPKDIENTLLKGWIYKKADEMLEETMLTCSKSTIERVFKSLVDKGFVSRRKNQKYRWDKTWQYRVNLQFINQELYKLGYALEGYSLQQNGDAESEPHHEVPKHHSEASKHHGEASKRHGDAAIPKITTKSIDTIDTLDTQQPDVDISRLSVYKEKTAAKKEEYMRKAFYENHDVAPEQIANMLEAFSNTTEQAERYYKIIILAKKKVEQETGVAIWLENNPDLLQQVIYAFSRAVRKIEKERNIENRTGYIYKAIYTVLANEVTTKLRVSSPEDSVLRHDWLMEGG